MPPILIVRDPAGSRLYIAGRRLHHGLAGQLLALIGLGLMLHDRRDYPWSVDTRPVQLGEMLHPDDIARPGW